MKIRMLLLVCAVLALTVGAASRTAAGGNSDGAKRCQKDGWQTLVRANGSPFKDQGDCTSYAAKGGTPKAPQSIAVTTHAPASAAYNTSFTVAATAPGGAVTYSSSGACTNVGAVFTMTSGTGICTVRYDQAGDSNYNPAPQVTESVNAQKADQSINVTTHAPASAVYDTSFTVAATASAPVSYSSSGACSNVGALFTMTSGTGVCTVTYDQAGDANYNAAPQLTESVNAQKADQSINVTTHAPASAAYHTTFTVEATAAAGPVAYSSSGPCTGIGGTFTITAKKGTCTVAYDQAGDLNYNAAPEVTESVLVAAAPAATTLAAASNAGDTNIKVTSTDLFLVTALAAGCSAGDTNIKVQSTDGLVAGQTINVDVASGTESAVIQSVGTAGAGGTGVTLTTPLLNAHESGSSVTPAGQVIHIDTGAAEEDATIQSVGTPGALGSGLTLTAPLASAHASGSPVAT